MRMTFGARTNAKFLHCQLVVMMRFHAWVIPDTWAACHGCVLLHGGRSNIYPSSAMWRRVRWHARWHARCGMRASCSGYRRLHRRSGISCAGIWRIHRTAGYSTQVMWGPLLAPRLGLHRDTLLGLCVRRRSGVALQCAYASFCACLRSAGLVGGVPPPAPKNRHRKNSVLMRGLY